MIQIQFKGMDFSEVLHEIAMSRLQGVAAKFEDLQDGTMVMSIEMQNSPLKAGPDFFTVKVRVKSGRYRGVLVEKSSSTVPEALAEVMEHMLEVLNRFGDRKRVVDRRQARLLRAKRVG